MISTLATLFNILLGLSILLRCAHASGGGVNRCQVMCNQCSNNVCVLQVIAATNIAETSLTIEGTVYVIDCMFAKQTVRVPPSSNNYSKCMLSPIPLIWARTVRRKKMVHVIAQLAVFGASLEVSGASCSPLKSNQRIEWTSTTVGQACRSIDNDLASQMSTCSERVSFHNTRGLRIACKIHFE